MLKYFFQGLQDRYEKHIKDMEYLKKKQLLEKTDPFSKLICEVMREDLDTSVSIELEKKEFSQISLDLFTIKFSSIFDHDEIKKSFKTFLLKEDYNHYALDFIDKVQKMKSCSIKEQNRMFVEILKSSFEKKAIKINKSTKNDLCKHIITAQESNLENPYEILTNVQKQIEIYLIYEHFPRFIRQKDSIQQFTFLRHDSLVCSVHTPLKLEKDDSYFNQLFFTKFDLDFMISLSKDTYEWDHQYGAKGINIYTSKTNYTPKSKFFQNATTIKANGIFPVNFKTVLSKLKLEDLSKSINLTSSIETKYHSLEELQKLNPNEEIIGSSFEFDEIINFPFPFNTQRRVSVLISCIYDQKEDCYNILMKPYLGKFKVPEQVNWNEKNPIKEINFDGYFIPNFHFIQIKKLGENETMVTHVKIFDFKGYLSGSKQFIPFILRWIFPNLRGKLEKEIQESKNDLKNDGVLSKLLMEIYKENSI